MMRSLALPLLPLAALVLALVAQPAAAAPAGETAPAVETRGFYLQLIHQARADGRPRAALAYLEDFDRRYPGDVDARLLRVDSLLDLGQVDGAEAALASLPGNASGARVSAARGHILAARGQWAQAVPFYRAATGTNPADPLLRNALGYALLRAGATGEAIEALRGATDLAPSDPVIRNNLLLALAVGGRDADVAAVIGQIRDRQAQAELRGQIAAEARRIALPLAATPAKGSH
jgi:Flp pilus assembly protein TadD